jgi:hypothetical protein
MVIFLRNETPALSTPLLLCFAEIGNPGAEIIPDILSDDTFPTFRLVGSTEVLSWRSEIAFLGKVSVNRF